jgi:hypothetical protein
VERDGGLVTGDPRSKDEWNRGRGYLRFRRVTNGDGRERRERRREEREERVQGRERWQGSTKVEEREVVVEEVVEEAEVMMMMMIMVVAQLVVREELK